MGRQCGPCELNRPGTILTPLVERNFELGLLDREECTRADSSYAAWCNLERVARVARFLLSDDASYVTGQTINVDGGWKFGEAGNERYEPRRDENSNRRGKITAHEGA